MGTSLGVFSSGQMIHICGTKNSFNGKKLTKIYRRCNLGLT